MKEQKKEKMEKICPEEKRRGLNPRRGLRR